MIRKEECACFLLAGEFQRMCTMMSDDSKLPPMRDLTSIDQVRNRFATEDIELTCRKRVEMEITILHPTNDDGRPIFRENIEVGLGSLQKSITSILSYECFSQ